ncbi:MAG TPA: hypothetical protein VNZ03_23885 [Terriglobales bacterium]|jgi:hypothetical protein|nr:hypothetical protein [Terriglobales bacterium]
MANFSAAEIYSVTVATKVSYGMRWVPNYFWQRISRRVPRGPLHLMITLADHFEPAIVPGNGYARAPYTEQIQRLETWCEQYPKLVGKWHDHDGHTFKHTYFYPAEQYDAGLVSQLADHCRAGWGEIEVHLHHGMNAPDTALNTHRTLVNFRDTLASQHRALSYLDGAGSPVYAFVHGNFALANSSKGVACGVDSEMQVLAETGCYADMTLPTGYFHPAQIGKINSLYECGMSLSERAPHRRGRDLRRGRAPAILPIMVQGPLMLDFASTRSRHFSIENGALTRANPPSLSRLQSWKRAAVRVAGRPDWLFIKLHCHSMDPTQHPAVLGDAMSGFLRELVEGANQRGEFLHFVSAREMVNIIFAACDGHEGNPGQYRNYRLKLRKAAPAISRNRVAEAV